MTCPNIKFDFKKVRRQTMLFRSIFHETHSLQSSSCSRSKMFPPFNNYSLKLGNFRILPQIPLRACPNSMNRSGQCFIPSYVHQLLWMNWILTNLKYTSFCFHSAFWLSGWRWELYLFRRKESRVRIPG